MDASFRWGQKNFSIKFILIFLYNNEALLFMMIMSKGGAGRRGASEIGQPTKRGGKFLKHIFFIPGGYLRNFSFLSSPRKGEGKIF